MYYYIVLILRLVSFKTKNHPMFLINSFLCYFLLINIDIFILFLNQLNKNGTAIRPQWKLHG